MSTVDTYPQAPSDASGGFMTIQYSNGTDTHRHRVHVLPFSRTKFIIGGGTPSVDTDDGAHDYAYQPDRPAGMEAGITDTFQAYVNTIKPFFATNWQFSLLSLYQMVSGAPVEVFPVPTPTPIAGSSASAPAAGQKRALEAVWSLRTASGGKGRLIFIGMNNDYDIFVPEVVSSTIGTTVPKAVMAYLVGSATAVVAHDGHKFMDRAHITYAMNRRLRRHYGYA